MKIDFSLQSVKLCPRKFDYELKEESAPMKTIDELSKAQFALTLKDPAIISFFAVIPSKYHLAIEEAMEVAFFDGMKFVTEITKEEEIQ